jgi:ubiquinone/menaquinone biosynthesis C-methylase UbiE
MKINANTIQEEYYKQTAENYDSSHLDIETDYEHSIALHFLSSMIRFYSIKSILDVGAGTGRTIHFIMKEHPGVSITGIEPIKEMREQGHKKGIPASMLIEGDGNKINFADGEFDLVCEFGVLHHIPNPGKVVSEMLRVANKCIFISDSNNFGQGNFLNRSIKQLLNFAGLWPLFNSIRTGGKGYQISEGDGLFYSYSVFDNYKQIKRQCREIHLLNTKEGCGNLYRTAPHIALLAKR